MTAIHGADPGRPTAASAAPAGVAALGDTPAAVFSTVDLSTIEWCNPALGALLGRDDDVLVGAAFSGLLTAAARARVHAELESSSDLVDAGRRIVLDLQRGDRTTLSLLCAVSPLGDVPPDRHLWVGIDVSERAERERSLEASHRRLSRLQRLSGVLLQAETGPDIATAVLEELVDGVKADHGVLLGVAPDRAPSVLGTRTAPTAAGPRPQALGGTDVLGTIVEAHYSTIASADAVQVAALPLLGPAGICGVLAIAVNRAAPFDDGEKQFLRAATEMTAHALQRAELQRRERADKQRSSFMARLVHALETVNTVSERAQIVADLLVPDYADYATIEMPGRGPAPVGLRHRDDELAPLLRELRTAVSVDAAQPHSLAAGRESRKPQLLEKIDDALYTAYGLAPHEEQLLRTLAPVSYLGVPLVTRDDHVIGSVLLAHSSSGRRFDAEHASHFTRVAAAAALLLDNARLYEEQASTAGDLQLALLPPDLPADPRIELHSLYEPNSELAMVGGDWYDAFFLTDDRIALVVGDIVGGGVRAAATMGQLKVAVRAYALDGHDVDATLERLERFVHRLPEAMHASLCFAIVDLAASTLSYSCAGHPPPIRVSATGETSLLDSSRQRVLGCNADTRASAEVALAPGDAVLFYTDGLVERRGSTITDDIAGLADLLSGNPALVRDLPALAARLDAGAHHDDTTALSVVLS